MYSLNLPTEPYWLNLPHGVRVQVRPLGAAVIAAAGARARTVMTARLADQAALRLLGADVPDPLDPADPAAFRGFVDQEMAIGLAQYGILAWEGVGNEAGTDALPITPEALEQFGRNPIGLDFLAAYQKPQQALAVEGNASAPMPAGGGAPGATTAAAVPTTAPTASPSAQA